MGEVCRKARISEATYYGWRKAFDVLAVHCRSIDRPQASAPVELGRLT